MVSSQDVNGNGVMQRFTVKYDKSGSSGGKTEAGIPYSHLPEIPSPFGSKKLVRERQATEMLDNLPPQPPITPQLKSTQEILAAGATRGKHKGWRAKELGVVHYGSRSECFQNLLCEDTKELLGFLLGKSTVVGTGGSTRHNKKGRDGRFAKRKTQNNPHNVTYLAKAWGVGKNFPLKNLKKGADYLASSTKPDQTTNPPVHLSVIDSLEAAKIHYSARSLFVADRIHERTDQEAVFAYESSTQAERQMQHMNNLDLAVFPMMSKRHSALLKNYSLVQAPPEVIWHTRLSKYG